jgi:prepilin-type N-terminal cleavage/methylation domain-containing protein
MKGYIMRQAGAFTLVEILIVVVLLGVLAAIVVPSLTGSVLSSRDSALAGDIRLLRTFILVYTAQHLEVPPGYPNGDPRAAPDGTVFRDQATLSSNEAGQTAPLGTAGFRLGPYLSRVPRNPFNGLDTVQMLGNGEAFPGVGDDTYGWIYRPASREIKPGNSGTNLQGLPYYEY